MTDNAPAPSNGPAPSTPPAGGSQQQAGGGDGSQPTPPATPQQQATPQPPAPTGEAQPQDPQQAEQQEPGQGLENASHDELLAEIRTLRRENARRRTDNTQAVEQAQTEAQQQIAQQIAQALGITQEAGESGEAPSVEDLTTQLEQVQQERRTQAVEFAAWRQSSDLGVDPQALLNQMSFHNAVQSLDPASETFDDDIKAAIEAERKRSPFIVTTPQTPGRSGNPLGNTRGADDQGDKGFDPAGLAAAVRKKNPY